MALWRSDDVRPALRVMLERRFQCEDAILTNSGTNALAVAIRHAAAMRSQLPCAMPAYGCYDLLTAAIAADVRVEFYDLDPITLAPQADSLASAVSRGVSSIVIVHQYGMPVPMDPVLELADQSGAIVIEDAAQGAGGSWRGTPLGATGEFGILSFGRGKGLTGGGGGALLSKGRESVSRLEDALLPVASGTWVSLVTQLIAQWTLGHPNIYLVPSSLPFLHVGETRFRQPEDPRMMHPACARVLMHTIAFLDSETQARQNNAEQLSEVLKERGTAQEVLISEGGEPSWLRLPVLGLRTNALLRSGRPLGCVPGYPTALPDRPEAASVLTRKLAFSGARELAGRLWTVPVHSRLTKSDLKAVGNWLEKLPR